MTRKILECMDGVGSHEINEQGKRERIKLVNEIGEEIRIKNVVDWLLTLASAMGRGWKPNGNSMSYSAHGRIIPKEESLIIAVALEKLICTFQNNIENLNILIEFLKKGMVRIGVEDQELSQ